VLARLSACSEATLRPASAVSRSSSLRREPQTRLQIGERSLRLAIVQARQDRAAFDRFALAIAQLHDPLANEGRYLRPNARLDHAGGINDLCRGSARWHGDADDRRAESEPVDRYGDRGEDQCKQKDARKSQRS
jgi:hypothetical protein